MTETNILRPSSFDDFLYCIINIVERASTSNKTLEDFV